MSSYSGKATSTPPTLKLSSSHCAVDVAWPQLKGGRIDLGFRFRALGFRVEGSGFRSLGIRVQGSEFRV